MGYEYFSTSLPIPTVLQLLAAFLPQDLGACLVHSLGGPIHPCFPLILKQLLSHPTPFACFHIALLYITPCERSLCIPLVLFFWLPAPLEKEEPLVRTYPDLAHTHSTFWSSAWHLDNTSSISVQRMARPPNSPRMPASCPYFTHEADKAQGARPQPREA